MLTVNKPPNLMSPVIYAGEESVTYPNGLIEKSGIVVLPATTAVTVTFDTPFPNVIGAVVMGMRSTTHVTYCLRLDSKSVNNIVIDNANGVQISAEWIAKGY